VTRALPTRAARRAHNASDGELPNDLTCEKDGFFVAGFERAGARGAADPAASCAAHAARSARRARAWAYSIARKRTLPPQALPPPLPASPRRAGVFSATQGAGFPLSAALCCRPCFGDDAASTAASADVAAVVSTACVQSRWEGGGQVCPEDSFVMGYATARLGSPINRYYPVGAATCCRPALLLRNGTQRLLRRCSSAGAACGAPTPGSEVSCGGADDLAAAAEGGRLLAGWSSVLRQPGSALGLADAIPLAPARCCGACLDAATPARGLPCEALNFCSAHGACGVAGRCVCDHGWSGAACAEASSPAQEALLASAPLLALAALAAGIAMAALAARASALSRALASARRAAAAAAAARRAELEQPLLSLSSSEGDEEWGAGSSEDDSSDEDADGGGDATAGASGTQAQQQQQPATVAATREGAPDSEGYAPPAEVSAEDKPPTAAEDDAVVAADGDAATAAAAAAAAIPRRNWLRNAPECNGAYAALQQRMHACHASAENARVHATATADARTCASPPPVCTFAVCMDARVQICFLPCGHACACRSCARRMRRCPICRVVVARRQKLFLSSGLD
jgi:hypothetical protein